MSNTVEYKGNVYEIGKLYECEITHIIGILKSFDGSKPHPFIISIKGEHGKETIPCCGLLEIDAELGTITKAPVKLINGEAYQFSCDLLYLERKVMGVYRKMDHSFYNYDGDFSAELCTNIVKLVPEASHKS